LTKSGNITTSDTTTGSFTNLSTSTHLLLTFHFTAPAAPETGDTITLSSSITSPTCTSGGGNQCSDSITYTVGVFAPPAISKAFSPSSINVGGASTLSFTPTNSNGSALTNAAFSDPLPAGLQVSSTPSASNTCGGTFSAGAGATTVSLTGGTIPANGSCTLSVSVTATTSGTKNNTTGTITANGGGLTLTGNTASSSLTVSATVPTTLVMNSVSPSSVAFGSTGPVTFMATLTRNDTSAGVVGATVNFTVDGVGAGSATTGAGGIASLTTYHPSALTVAAHNVAASFSAATISGTQYGASTSGTQTLTVGKATPTITWANPADITYGTALGAGQLNATASVPGSFAYTPAAGTVLNAGNGQTLHVDFTPTDTTNYTNASKDVTVNVNRKNATWTTNPSSKTYGDADPSPLTTGSGSGFLASDNVTATYSRAAGETVAGGPYLITATLSPAAALSNYNITNAGANFTINTRSATWTTQAASKTYGDADPNPLTTGSGSNFVAADNVTATYSRAAGETVLGGPYHITATLGPSGVLSNYNITNAGADFTISKRNATWTTQVASKTYGDADPNPLTSGSGANFVDPVSATYSRASGESVAGNPYHITAALSAAAGVLDNYNVTNTGADFTINKRLATWTTVAAGKTYGDADPNPLTTGSGANFVDPVTATYSRAAGETVAGGPNHITAALSAGAGVLDNYIVTNNGADFTISKRNATWTTQAASKTYGDADPNPLTTGSGANFVDPATATYSRAAGETVAGGPYHITATLSAAAGVLDNYNVTNAGADFTISRRNATWTTQTASKTYGDPDPSPLTTGSGTNVVDPVSATYSRAAGETVLGGPYHITATLSAAAGVLDNYNVTNTGADFTINKRLATWTTAAAGKTYGDADPNPLTTGSGSNFLPADGVTASYSRAAGETVLGGPYPITATLSPAAVLSNYSITNNGAAFTIATRPATWTTQPASKNYADSDPNPLTTGSGSNFVTADGVTATYSRASGETVQAGGYHITANLSPTAVLSNYALTNTGATFTINPDNTATGTAGAAANYGDVSVSLQATVTNTTNSAVINEGNVTFTVKQGVVTIGSVTSGTVAGGVATASFPLGTSVHAGSYAITATFGPSTDFNQSSTTAGSTGTLIVNQDSTSVTPMAAGATYGTASVTLNATVSNTTNSAAVNGGTVTFTVRDNLNNVVGTVTSGTVTAGAASASFTLGPSVNAGNYAIATSYSGSTDFKSSSSIASATLSVTKATTTLAVVSSLNPSVLNQPVTFTATVTPQIAGTPTGTVTFVDTTTNTSLGTGTSIGSGKWTLTTSAIPVNANLITATYGGDMNFTGSSGSTTQTVQYAVGGVCNGDAGHQILQPINVDGTSVFNSKSTSPAKFRVCDANGVSIGAAGAVKTFVLYQTISGTVTNTVNESVDSTTPDNNFRWDPTAQQWIFNINNKALWANQTYIFLITLNDGSTISFRYGLR